MYDIFWGCVDILKIDAVKKFDYNLLKLKKLFVLQYFKQKVIVFTKFY
jgi:hypothetical protein